MCIGCDDVNVWSKVMNERIKELAEQAGAEFYADTILVNGKDADDLMRKFAELIVRECINVASNAKSLEAAAMIKQRFGIENEIE